MSRNRRCFAAFCCLACLGTFVGSGAADAQDFPPDLIVPLVDEPAWLSSVSASSKHVTVEMSTITGNLRDVAGDTVRSKVLIWMVVPNPILGGTSKTQASSVEAVDRLPTLAIKYGAEPKHKFTRRLEDYPGKPIIYWFPEFIHVAEGGVMSRYDGRTVLLHSSSPFSFAL